jgi:hypothetical protein
MSRHRCGWEVYADQLAYLFVLVTLEGGLRVGRIFRFADVHVAVRASHHEACAGKGLDVVKVGRAAALSCIVSTRRSRTKSLG